MKDLLTFILTKILKKGAQFQVEEKDENNVVTLIVTTQTEDGGLVIGKGGKTIKAIRNLLRIKATLEKKKIVLLVNPQEATN